MTTETAGVGGLKIAETFPEGRGSPHGCGLRAVFCTDAASARPEACRDKSKAPRSGDFGGQSPGVQGGGGDWPPPVRSLRHGKHIAEKLTGSAISSETTHDKRFSQAKKLQTDNSIYSSGELMVFPARGVNALAGLQCCPGSPASAPDYRSRASDNLAPTAPNKRRTAPPPQTRHRRGYRLTPLSSATPRRLGRTYPLTAPALPGRR